MWVQGRVLGRGHMPKSTFSGKTEVLGGTSADRHGVAVLQVVTAWQDPPPPLAIVPLHCPHYPWQLMLFCGGQLITH